MTRAEMVKEAFDKINKLKNVNFIVKDIVENDDGSVYFTCTYPSGLENRWGFSRRWFNPDHIYSDAVREKLHYLKGIKDPETLIICKLMFYISSIRDM